MAKYASRFLFMYNTCNPILSLKNLPYQIRMRSSLSSENVSDLRRFLLEFDADPKEGRYWLKYFKNFSDLNKPFAITHLEDGIFENEQMLKDLSSSICFLQRNGMKCILLHGTNLQLDSHIDIEMYKIIRERQTDNSLKLADSLENNRTPCRILFPGSSVILSQPFPLYNTNSFLKQATNGPNFVGKLSSINYGLIESSLNSDMVPLIPTIGETIQGQLLLMDPDEVIFDMSVKYKPLKILFINTTGGVYSLEDPPKVIPQVNLPSELNDLINSAKIDDVIHKRIVNISKMLESMLPQSSIVITSANQVLKELFTYRGSGTLFKHIDTFIQTNNIHDIDCVKLENLINKTFEKRLKSGFLESLQNKIDILIVSENYNAAAIVTHEDGLPISYLNKFVISSDIQGQGLSDTLWDHLKAKYKSLIWRSAHTNKINPWYFKHCDGCWSNKDWIIFWYGITDPESSNKAIHKVINIDIAFEPFSPPSNAPIKQLINYQCDDELQRVDQPPDQIISPFMANPNNFTTPSPNDFNRSLPFSLKRLAAAVTSKKQFTKLPLKQDSNKKTVDIPTHHAIA